MGRPPNGDYGTSILLTLYYLLVVSKAELDSVFPCQAGPPYSTATEAVRCVVAPDSLVEHASEPCVLSLMVPTAPGCHECGHLLEELLHTEPTVCPHAGMPLGLGNWWDDFPPPIGGKKPSSPCVPAARKSWGTSSEGRYWCKTRNNPGNN